VQSEISDDLHSDLPYTCWRDGSADGIVFGNACATLSRGTPDPHAPMSRVNPIDRLCYILSAQVHRLFTCSPASSARNANAFSASLPRSYSGSCAFFFFFFLPSTAK